NLLSYVPGFGMQQTGTFLLYAPRPVEKAYNGGTIEIAGLMATEQQVTARVVLRGYGEWSPSRIGLETEAGRSLDRGNAGGMGGGGYQEQWLTFTGTVDGRAQSLTVVVEDGTSLVRIPVPLVAATGESPLEQFGPSAVVNGLRVAARVQASGDRTGVSLLLMGEDPFVDGPGRPAYEAVAGSLTAPGWTGSLTQESMGLGQMRTVTAFGTLPDNVGQVQLTVDRILVAEQGEARLTIPTAPGRVDQVVRLGRWDVTVTHTEQVGDALRIHLDLGPAAGPAALFRVGAVTAPGEPSVVEEFWAPERRQQTWVDLKLQRQTEKVTLQLEHPEVLIAGPWVLDLPVDR
ncbi:MAG TPA: hypothetical protein VD973_13340, partial [Symbiobacteriaceae bacterium]|nr:hypothetical protein [Symbiobacteriaceae bacterium]